MFCKKGALRHFKKFTGKNLCRSLFFLLNCRLEAPRPLSFAWSLAPDSYLLALAPDLYLTALAPNLCLPALVPNLCLTALALYLYLLALASNLLYTSSGQDFTTTASATYTITTTTITTTTTTTTCTTRDNNNKRCLRSSKIHIKWPLKEIWWKSQVSVITNVSLNREVAAVKEIGNWLFLK